eukprot:s1532_g11.t2
MKLSQRFELLIAERRLQEASKHQTDGDILHELVAKYNDFKANSALKKWQISPDQLAAILGVIEGMTFEARQDYMQDLDALVTSKPNNLKVEMLSMFQDHIQKGIQKAVGGSSGQDVSADVEDAEDCLAHDYKEAVSYNLKRNKVVHMKNQLEVGLQVAEKFMEKRCLMLCTGMALVVCPILAGEGVLGGLRGEYRRIEDKFISMGMELKNVQVALDFMLELQEMCHIACYSQTDNPTIFQYALLQAQTQRPTPTAAALETDLAKETTQEVKVENQEIEAPPAMTMEKFKEKYPEVQMTVTLNMGQNVVCQVAGGKCFISAASTFRLVGANSSAPKPLFLYAGGSWISDNSKAKDFLSKPGNEGKGVEFRLESAKSMVLLEEQGPSGASDSSPMTLYELYLMLEKRSVVDFQVTSHDVDRPADVKAGNAADCLEVTSVEAVARPLTSRRHQVEDDDTPEFRDRQHEEIQALTPKNQVVDLQQDNRYEFGDGYVTPPISPKKWSPRDDEDERGLQEEPNKLEPVDIEQPPNEPEKLELEPDDIKQPPNKLEPGDKASAG